MYVKRPLNRPRRRIVGRGSTSIMVDVRVIAAQPNDLLASRSWTLAMRSAVAAIPIHPVTEGPRHSAARRLNRCVRPSIRFEGRQFAVPIDNLPSSAGGFAFTRHRVFSRVLRGIESSELTVNADYDSSGVGRSDVEP